MTHTDPELAHRENRHKSDEVEDLRRKIRYNGDDENKAESRPLNRGRRHEEHRRRSRSPDARDRRSRGHNRHGDQGHHSPSDRPSRKDRSRSERPAVSPRERRRHRPDERRESHRKTEQGRAQEDEGEGGDRARQAKRSGPLPSQADSFALVTTGEEPEQPKEQPNFGNTGVLATASNAVTQADGSTVALKYHEPPEARKPPPKDEWKLFVFKGTGIVDTVDLGRRSCWLVGRETAVVDLVAEHPSISKQHAAVQFRHIEKRNEYGDRVGRVRPYLIDLESANGTMLNKDKVPGSRYLELRDKDMVQFGHSSREYVIMLAPKE